MNQEFLSLWERYTLQKADAQTDFFESGGDSLSAINLIVELQKKFAIDVSLESFLRNPTIPFLEALISEIPQEAG